MADPTFEKKARNVGIELWGRLFLVNGSVLGLVFFGVIAFLIGEEHRIAGVMLGLFCALGCFLWWRFIRPFGALSKITCPLFGGRARVESSIRGYDLVCSRCGQRADTTLRTAP